MTQSRFDYDVVICGAGMVGASLAIALAPLGLRIAIIEAVSPRNDTESSYDDRGITLSPSSQRIFDSLGVWQLLQNDCSPIKHIHVSEQGRFGFTRLHAADYGVPALGYVVVARALGRNLLDALNHFDNIELFCPAELKQFHLTDDGMSVTWRQDNNDRSVLAGLLVGADGNRSLVRRLAGINVERHDFMQTAIVANITTEKTNDATAYERFTPHGPVALLPIDDHRSVLVYVVARDEVDSCLQLTDERFLQRVQDEAGRRLGRFYKVGQRRAYPIIYQQAARQFQKQLVLLGNSAHALHPNAAQGFNLGLRDVAGLVDAIKTGLDEGIGIENEMVLQNYIDARVDDQQRLIRLTNGLARCFYNRWPVVSSARNVAMLLIDVLPSLKHGLTQTLMGLSGTQPVMVRGSVINE